MTGTILLARDIYGLYHTFLELEWLVPVILAYGRLRQENCHKSEASLPYKMRLCLRKQNAKVFLGPSIAYSSLYLKVIYSLI